VSLGEKTAGPALKFRLIQAAADGVQVYAHEL
jgi:hypothetical protein